jgi:hypothetical protein
METGFFDDSNKKTAIAPLILEFIGSAILTISIYLMYP